VRRSELLERLPWVFQHAAGELAEPAHAPAERENPAEAAAERENPADAAAERENPLMALLGVMESMHGPDEEILANIDSYTDPRRAPDEFVPFLSWWVDMAWLFLDPPDDPHAKPGPPFPGGPGRLRELVASAAREGKWRGTSRGLTRLLEVATGVDGFAVQETVLDSDGARVPFRIQVRAPAPAEPYAELILRIAEHEKPAHVTLEREITFHDGSRRATRPDTKPQLSEGGGA
jgi:phage tail-like protein